MKEKNRNKFKTLNLIRLTIIEHRIQKLRKKSSKILARIDYYSVINKNGIISYRD